MAANIELESAMMNIQSMLIEQQGEKIYAAFLTLKNILLQTSLSTTFEKDAMKLCKLYFEMMAASQRHFGICQSLGQGGQMQDVIDSEDDYLGAQQDFQKQLNKLS